MVVYICFIPAPFLCVPVYPLFVGQRRGLLPARTGSRWPLGGCCFCSWWLGGGGWVVVVGWWLGGGDAKRWQARSWFAMSHCRLYFPPPLPLPSCLVPAEARLARDQARRRAGRKARMESGRLGEGLFLMRRTRLKDRLKDKLFRQQYLPRNSGGVSGMFCSFRCFEGARGNGFQRRLNALAMADL